MKHQVKLYNDNGVLLIDGLPLSDKTKESTKALLKKYHNKIIEKKWSCLILDNIYHELDDNHSLIVREKINIMYNNDQPFVFTDGTLNYIRGMICSYENDVIRKEMRLLKESRYIESVTCFPLPEKYNYSITKDSKALIYLDNEENREKYTQKELKGLKQRKKELKSNLKELKPKSLKENLPKSWEDLKDVEGFQISSPISQFKTQKQAKSALAYAQLTQLMHVYNNGWTPDWEDISQFKYCIVNCQNRLKIENKPNSFSFLCFKTRKLANHFYQHHEDLIKQFYMID